MDTVIWNWRVSELARELPSRVRLGNLPSAMLQGSWQGGRQWSLTPSSGMSGPWEFQHQLGTSGRSKPGECIPRQWKMSIGAGWSRSWQHLSVWLWVSVDWMTQPVTGEGVQTSDTPRSSTKKPLVLHLRGKPRELPLLSMAGLWYSPHWYYTNATRYICTASAQDKLSFSCGIVHSQNCWWVVPG